MGVADQIPLQAIATPTAEFNPGQVSIRLAVFTEDGQAIDLGEAFGEGFDDSDINDAIAALDVRLDALEGLGLAAALAALDSRLDALEA